MPDDLSARSSGEHSEFPHTAGQMDNFKSNCTGFIWLGQLLVSLSVFQILSGRQQTMFHIILLLSLFWFIDLRINDRNIFRAANLHYIPRVSTPIGFRLWICDLHQNVEKSRPSFRRGRRARYARFKYAFSSNLSHTGKYVMYVAITVKYNVSDKQSKL